MIIHSPFPLWSCSQKLHTVLCFAPCISLEAVWEWTPCLWCPCWLWTHTGFKVDGLQQWWVPICLGVHKQGFFPAMENRVIPLIVGAIWLFSLVFVQVTMIASWRPLGSLPCSQQQTRSLWSLLCDAVLLSRALVESSRLRLPCHSSNALWLW